jgi:Lysyl oxidase/Bacterial Ig domain
MLMPTVNSNLLAVPDSRVSKDPHFVCSRRILTVIPRHLSRISRHLSRSSLLLGWVLALVFTGLLVGVLRSADGSELPKPLLPNLVADPPDNMILGAESEDVEGGNPGTQLLLRFDGYVHNTGQGALDFRGERSAPKVSQKTTEEVEQAREHEESPLLPKTEEELATPPMKVIQRLYTTNEGNSEESEKYLERPHENEPSDGEMIYVNADGHHHWHLQKVARYSLWNATKTAEVAPAQKVGFCLEDSQHVETNIGPKTAVYADNVAPYRDFCQQYRPNATGVYEGISPGWRDVYTRDLAFQWVDVSTVLPGEYWLREDVNPLGVVKEEPEANQPAYAVHPTIIPGFDAQAQAVGTGEDEAKSITLASQEWQGAENGQEEEELPLPNYSIVELPKHGKLTVITGDQVTYTPEAGYAGADSFTFSAADPNSPFPTHPAIATVSVQVGEVSRPSVSIYGAPASMIGGTSVALAAAVANDSGGVEWSASAGSFTAEGAGGSTDNYVAPGQIPPDGIVTITARLKDDHDVSYESRIVILPVPVPVASPEVQTPPKIATTTGPSGPGSTKSTSTLPAVARPRVMLIGRKLIMTTYVTKPGHVRLSAFLGNHELGSCASETPAKRTFTCRVTLGPRISIHAHISVWASLRVGRRILQNLLPAAEVAQMKMAYTTAFGVGEEGISGSSWCTPRGAEA